MSRARLAALAVAASMVAGSAHADPVRITGGAIVFDIEGDFFGLRGTDFVLRGDMLGDDIPVDGPVSCFPCRPGVDRLDYSFTTTGGEVFLGSGPATFGGNSYSNVYYRAQLTVTAAARIFPTDLGIGGQVSEEFTLTGSLRAFLDPGFSDLAFATALAGGGLARTSWSFFEGAYFPDEGQTVYEFSPADPVPEPATFVLFGLGAAVLARRARRKF